MTQSRPKKDRTAILMRMLPLLLLIVLVALFFWWRHHVSRPASPPAEAEQAEAAPDTASPEPGLAVPEQQWLEATGQSPEWPDDFGQPVDCRAVIDRLRSLCNRLDERSYVREWSLPGGSFNALSQVADALDDDPPPLSGLFQHVDLLRSNVTHLFRALGRERASRLLRIVREEPWLAEPFSLALYQWLSSASRCEIAPRAPARERQYDYAAFLLQTIGGQGYLRRRSPRLEALASFYALQIVDRAVQRGHDPQGVDLRHEIARCEELIEGSQLVFRERYLEILTEMEARWKARGL